MVINRFVNSNSELVVPLFGNLFKMDQRPIDHRI